MHYFWRKTNTRRPFRNICVSGLILKFPMSCSTLFSTVRTRPKGMAAVSKVLQCSVFVYILAWANKVQCWASFSHPHKAKCTIQNKTRENKKDHALKHLFKDLKMPRSQTKSKACHVKGGKHDTLNMDKMRFSPLIVKCFVNRLFFLVYEVLR